MTRISTEIAPPFVHFEQESLLVSRNVVVTVEFLHYQTISLITYLIISTYLITLLLSLYLAFFHETDCVNKLIIKLITS